jgi:hypothetical protein
LGDGVGVGVAGVVNLAEAQAEKDAASGEYGIGFDTWIKSALLVLDLCFSWGRLTA